MIKKSKNKLEEAYQLINTGYKLDPHDEHISRNYKTISPQYQEMLKYQEIYKLCSDSLPNENDFVLIKLRVFLSNVDRDPTFKLGKIPIPSWKFCVLMATDKQKANSLKEQWIEKSYIRAIAEKGEYGEPIYEINLYEPEDFTFVSYQELAEIDAEGETVKFNKKNIIKASSTITALHLVCFIKELKGLDNLKRLERIKSFDF